ncbi:hypothetical protein KUV85_07465 [Nocardioides panacisoli]|uniref:hypothetical protein n=1 Tax=Nocardioides panacisoli TaxID=627624 RepID=UPI001C626B1B|nr:hypothetical protein [Nocardioides panacisoli]QYJ05506.1 hypothetical protein KUV85_07465 [Nocardioides panacisoli]
MRWPGRTRPAVDVARGERLLASAERTDGAGAVGGTRDALYLPERVAWEQVATAEWDRDEEVLRVVVLAEFGSPQPTHDIGLHDPDRLLQLVRERVSASFVVQRFVEVAGGRGARILARRPPAGGEIRWLVEYDDGLDPAAPGVAAVVEPAVAATRAEIAAG